MMARSPGVGVLLTSTAATIDRSVFRQVLTARTSAAEWSRWFKDLHIELTSSEILLVAPSRFVANQVASRFLAEVESAVRTAGAAGPSGIRVTFDPNSATRPPPPGPSKRRLPTREAKPSPRSRHPTSHHRFDNFEVGTSSLLAHAAATSVAEKPGRHYNPLFIYGASGLGKTHLLLALAHRAKENQPDLRVRYCTSERFVQEFIESVTKRRMQPFRRRFREVDMLILDDFQFLRGKEQTLEEFYWTLDCLLQGGNQVVLGCDRSPRELDAVADRIRSRVSAGLIAELTSPNLETRLVILEALNHRGPVLLSDDVLQMVAEHITDNIRDLASALRQLHAYAQLTNQPVTPETVCRQLAPLSGRPPMPRTPETIVATCADFFETSVDEILAHNRRPVPSEARQIAMYLTRQITGLPYARIGAVFHRQHSTVLSAHRRVASQISRDPRFANQVTTVYNLIHSS